jgi:hypothetical protein
MLAVTAIAVPNCYCTKKVGEDCEASPSTCEGEWPSCLHSVHQDVFNVARCKDEGSTSSKCEADDEEMQVCTVSYVCKYDAQSDGCVESDDPATNEDDEEIKGYTADVDSVSCLQIEACP